MLIQQFTERSPGWTPARKSDRPGIVILAPDAAAVPRYMGHTASDSRLHGRLMREMQRLRGRVYYSDGAIGAGELASDGAHCLPIDSQSWHVLSVESDGGVSGCARYLQHSAGTRFEDLWVSSAAIAHCADWGWKVREAIETEIARARAAGLAYAEVGGWAVSSERRCRLEALRVALTAYALGQVLGGTLGVSTVTVRNHSSEILRRIGGDSFYCDGEEIPTYFDPQYGCQMELLRFDSRLPNPKFLPLIDGIRSELLKAPVVCGYRFGTQDFVQGTFDAAGLRSFEPQLALAG